jgi:hypothetical protein
MSAGIPAATPVTPRAAAVERLLASPWVWGVCFALGLAGRLSQFLHGASYWYDEAYLLLNVFQRGYGALLGRIDHDQVMPPVFLWLLRTTFQLAGGGELAMRLPATLAGVAALGLLFPLARRAVGRPGWVWAVCFAALSSNMLIHGNEVHPYCFDLLTMEAVLLGTLLVLTAESPRGRRGGWAALWTLAVVGPWLSFPSAFALGGASAALFWANRRGATRPAWLAWLAFNGLAALSGLSLWYVSARYLYYPGMRELWGPQGWGGFPDLARPVAALTWGLSRLPAIGQYGTDDMGYAMALLAVVGLVALARRCPAVAVAFAVPLLLALAAAFLGKYPLADRTLMFAVPCVWLPAAVGVEVVRRRVLARWPVAALALPAVLLLPGFLHMTKFVAVERPNPAFREAFAFVDTARDPGDVVWVAHEEVYEVYRGPQAPVLGADAVEQLTALAARHRVWLVSSLAPAGRGPSLPEAIRGVERVGGHCILRQGFAGLEVALYEPPPALP